MSTVPTFLDNLYSKGTISTEVLGVSFAPESGSDDDDANGELTLGGTDSSKYTGSITYAPKSTSSSVGPYWGVAVSAIKYGSTSLGSGSGIVDTGTTLIYIPSSAYSKFLSASGGKTDSSTGLAKFTKKPTGTFSFTIGGTVLSLTPAQYLIPTAQYSNFGISGSAYYSWINDGGSSGVDFIIGQKFLENYYSVFDTTYVTWFLPYPLPVTNVFIPNIETAVLVSRPLRRCYIEGLAHHIFISYLVYWHALFMFRGIHHLLHHCVGQAYHQA